MSSYRYILSGGGSGGHIYPAIAIAEELKKRQPKAEFLFVGAQGKMEMEKVPQAGYPIQGLWISGLQRKQWWRNLLLPVKLIRSLWQARKILKQFKPHIAIGTGGYASGPLLEMAARMDIPYLLYEGNSLAGVANRLLANYATTICTAYDGMERFFPEEKIVKTGNPVRSDLVAIKASREEAATFFGLEAHKKTVLVLGGSLGARGINQHMEKKRDFFTTKGWQVLWQCGSFYSDEYIPCTTKSVKVLAFINRMDLAYTLADVIISRAGCGLISELCLVGKPVLFIPSPNVAEDHQTQNAKALVDQEAAIMVQETKLDAEFETVFSTLIDSEEMQNKLSANLKKRATPQATERIVDEIEKIVVGVGIE